MMGESYRSSRAHPACRMTNAPVTGETPVSEGREVHCVASYQYIYTMKGLTKVHQPDKVVLKDIWLSFFPGAKIGVLGANGAGKSTLLRIMAGQDKDFNGEA